MAFSKKPTMPPPGGGGKKPALAIAIGVGKPKGSAASDPDDDAGQEPDNDPDDDSSGGKMSADKALSVREDQHCRNCKNYEPMDGSCEKVEGQWNPEDACWVNFEPNGDQSDQGGDNDSSYGGGAGGGMMPPPDMGGA